MRHIRHLYSVSVVLIFWLVFLSVCRMGSGAQAPKAAQDAASARTNSSALEVLTTFDRFIRRHLISQAHPLTDPPDPPEDVEYAFRLLQTNESDASVEKGRETDKVAVRLAAGESLPALITLSQMGHKGDDQQSGAPDGAYIVVGAMGALLAVHNPSLHLQNMSFSLVNRTLGYNKELSFVYPLAVHAAFPPGPCVLRLTVFLERVWVHRDILEHLGISADQVTELLADQPNASIAAFLERKASLGYSVRVLDGLVEITPAMSGQEYRLLFTLFAIVASTLVALVAFVSSVDIPSTRKLMHWTQRFYRSMQGTSIQTNRSASTRTGRTDSDLAPSSSSEWLVEHHQMMRSIVGTGSKGAVRVTKTQ
ncbi:hypothetical protein CCYA_CCYA03G0927 [Cyanidiococcus yangmingshanensis]|nr:hypothetical protein CCYA_CCYA03G0927 [Cyanidiococcus yangmingshanensis]